MPAEPISYEEKTPWPAWVVAVMSAGFLTAAFAIVREGLSASPGDATVALAVAALLVLGPLAMWLLFGHLRVQVGRQGMRLGFGTLPILRKTVPFSEIREIEPVRYSPLRDFGGWGIRFGLGGKRAWTIRGNRAVRLTLSDGKRLYVGSPHPERLAEALRAAGGGRWRSASDEPGGTTGS